VEAARLECENETPTMQRMEATKVYKK